MSDIDKRPIHASAVAKFAVALFLVLIGVMSIILLNYAGYSPNLSISIFFVCIAAAIYLLSSVLLIWLVRRRRMRGDIETYCLKYSHLVSGGVSFLFLSVLSIILLSSYGVSPFVYIACFSVLVAFSLVAICVGVYRIVNGVKKTEC